MQSRRAFIRTGIAGLFLVAAVMMRECTWVLILLAIFALFLIVLGHRPKQTKAVISQIGGSALLRAVDYLESILEPRDEQLEMHYRALIHTRT